MLAWIDLETTGLDPRADSILEVAAIVTDDALQEVARFHRIVFWGAARYFAALQTLRAEEKIFSEQDIAELDPVVVHMHTKNGLWKEAATTPCNIGYADGILRNFLDRFSAGPQGQKAQMAGSTITLDREFMRIHLPRSLEALHYRSIDVTTMHELARRFWPTLHQEAPAKREMHRAIPDIEDSLALCRYYTTRLSA